MAVWDGKRKVLGTSPMGLPARAPASSPLVWDQASSVMAQGEVLLAAQRGESLPMVSLSTPTAGRPPTRARCSTADRSCRSRGIKAPSIALMIEIIAGALTGGCFGFEDRSGEYPGAQTSKAGQTVILIDPLRVPGNRYFGRIESLLRRSPKAASNGFPAERRYARREQALRDGIAIVSDRSWAQLRELLA